MLALQEDFFLELSVLDLVVFNKDILPNSLDSVLQTSGFQLSQEDLSESTTTQEADELEVLVLHIFMLGIAMSHHHGHSAGI